VTARETSSALTGYQPIGSAMSEAAAADGDAREWRFVAADGSRVTIAVLAADLARVQLLPPGLSPAHSWAVADDAWPAGAARAAVGENGLLTLTTDAMCLELGDNPFRLTCRWPDGLPFAEDDPELGMGWVASQSHSTNRWRSPLL
jgi:hypothetical protein